MFAVGAQLKTPDPFVSRVLLAAGADVNGIKASGYPLIFSVCNPIVLRLFLNAGSDVDARGPAGTTSLHYAALGDADLAEALIRHGADPNSRDVGGETPLFQSEMLNEAGMIDLLVANGADVNAQRSDGYTVLHVTAISGHRAVAEALLRNGADTEVQDDEGKTPLIIASFMDIWEIDIAGLLIAHGALLSIVHLRITVIFR